MPLSHKYKTIFVHIPKNAGESIEKTLDMYGLKDKDPKKKLWGTVNNKVVLQHLTANQLKNFYLTKSIWNSYFKFAVIRNPFSKAVSEFNWFLRYGPQITFREWCESLPHRLEINNKINILETGHNVEQYKFVTDNKGSLLVDKIILFEDLSNEFKNLATKKSWEVELINSEATKSIYKKDWRSYYCRESLKIVSKIYKKDLEIFGYNIEDTFRNIKIKNSR